MLTALRVFAIFYVFIGVVYVIKPSSIKAYIRFWATQPRFYLGGVIALCLGVIFLRAAVQCHWPKLISLFGAMAVTKGLGLFVFRLEKWKPLLKWVEEQADHKLRLVGVLAILIGALLFLGV